MVHAYNTGRTTKQREQGENTLEKAAEFQLADADAVLKTLYPETVKTSAEVQRAQVVSGEYALSPAGMLARRRNEMQKAAAAAVALPANTYVRPPRDEHAAAMRAHSEKVASQRAEEETRRQASAAYTKAAAAMDELTVYFRTPGNMAFQDAVREVGLRHGDVGVSVLKKVAAVYPHIEKQAATNKRMFGSDRVYELVEHVLDSVSTYTEAQGRVAVKKAADGAREVTAPVVITGSVLVEEKPLELKQSEFVPSSESPPVPSPVPEGPPTAPPARPFTQKNDPVFKGPTITKPLQVVGYMMGMGGEKAPADPSEKLKAQYNSISDPSHDAAIKSIRAKSVLHDLIINDPIVSGHDPQDVAMAFNDIAELAPNLIETPGMLQTVLRKRLESGQLADFDVKQILEMDKLRAERDKVQGEARRISMENM